MPACQAACITRERGKERGGVRGRGEKQRDNDDDGR